MVTLYHGTTFENARAIVKAGKIARTDEVKKRYESTRVGFVYVTKRLADAMDFSTRSIVGQPANIIIVFKIEINEAELEQDPDEKNWHSTLSYNGSEECYRVSRDLLLSTDVKAVYVRNCRTPEALGIFLQQINYGDVYIEDSQWYSYREENSTAERILYISRRAFEN